MNLVLRSVPIARESCHHTNYHIAVRKHLHLDLHNFLTSFAQAILSPLQSFKEKKFC